MSPHSPGIEIGSSGRIRRCLPLYFAALKQFAPQ